MISYKTSVFLLGLIVHIASSAESSNCIADGISVRCKLLPSEEYPLELKEEQSILYISRAVGEVHEGTFKSLPHLLELEIYSGITHIQPGAFDGLDSVVLINLFNNSIEKIEQGTFRGCKALTHLVMSRNKINTIEPEAFAGLDELRYLDLSRNKDIGILKSHMFSGLSSLTFFQCVVCGIHTIEPLAFNDTPHLEEINLRSNNLTEIVGTEFEQLPKLEVLSLSWNNLTHIDADKLIERNEKLRKISLRNNPLSSDDVTNIEIKFLSQSITAKVRTL